MKKLIFAALFLSTTAHADLYCNGPTGIRLCTERYGHYPSLVYENYQHMINHLNAIGYPLPVKLYNHYTIELPGLNYVEDMFGSWHNR